MSTEERNQSNPQQNQHNSTSPTGMPQGLDTAPDDMHPALRVLAANIKMIAVVLGAIIVVVAATSIYSTVQENARAEARASLAELTAIADPAERAKKLSAFLVDAPEVVQTATALALAEVSMSMGNYADAQTALAVVSLDDGVAVSAIGTLGQAAALVASGDNTAALTLLSGVNVPAPYTTAADRMTAVAADGAGDTAAALAAWQRVLEAEPQNSFAAARVRALQS